MLWKSPEENVLPSENCNEFCMAGPEGIFGSSWVIEVREAQVVRGGRERKGWVLEMLRRWDHWDLMTN